MASYNTLKLWKNQTLEQRCDKIEAKYGKRITRTTLANIYKRNGIRNLKPGYKWHLGKTTEEEYASKKSIFLKTLLRLMNEGKQIIYLDETSTHMWEKRSRVWMPQHNPIHMRLQKDRGKSRTIIGAISKGWPLMKYAVVDKTNTRFFCQFLKYICSDLESPINTYIVLDNHAAHKSKKAEKFASNLGVKLFFLPPTASELNPIERMWSYFKT